MTEIAAKILSDDVTGVLHRVEAGEEITITVEGQAVAVLQPVRSRPRWMSRANFVAQVLAHQADPALTQELRLLVPDTTDTLPQ